MFGNDINVKDELFIINEHFVNINDLSINYPKLKKYYY